ncbi:MAG: helix-turn-helix domain-containing protein [Sporomusaceae bacterium]|jgi:putative transcriptional regulator|nr:helix-turn-helix domain-containing protein [Sporomusaceae bacterium]
MSAEKQLSLAEGILKGLNEAISHAKGEPVSKIKETVIHTANARFIREKLNMSQFQFSQAYKIPLATLKNWEQGRRNPDATASAYLWAIEQYPQEIKQAHEMRKIESKKAL